MASKAKPKIVTEYLERIDGRVLAEHQPNIKSIIKGYAGVYALYKRDKLYYVGLATDLMSRVKTHLKDRHAGNGNDLVSISFAMVNM